MGSRSAPVAVIYITRRVLTGLKMRLFYNRGLSYFSSQTSSIRQPL